MNKTNMNKTNKQVKSTKAVKAVKSTKAVDTRSILGKCSTVDWFKSERTRPKYVQMSFERTSEGYRLISGTILKQTNQYTSKWIDANKRALVKDVAERGMYSC